MLHKILSLLLALSILLSFAACGAQPEQSDPQPSAVPETIAPETVAPTEPSAADVYADALAALNNAADISLELLVTTLTTVAGDEFSEQSAQTLTYRGIGTDNPIIALDEEIIFSVHSEDYDPAGDEAEPIGYQEIWSQGSIYAKMDDTYLYCSPMDAETAAARYIPVVLLNAELYGSITSETAVSGTTITFAEPSAPELWALPEDGELVKSSGSVQIDPNGCIESMHYTITYKYGTTEITRTVESKPLKEVESVPEFSADDYSPIDYIDALRLFVTVPSMMFQADDVTVSSLESMMTQAAGVMRNQSQITNVAGRKSDTKAKVEIGVYFMDYSTGENQEYDLEQTYTGGKLTTVENDGLPSVQTIGWEDIRAYAAEQMLYGLAGVDFWQNVTATDLGSVVLLEYQLNDNFGNTIQNSICDMLWGDSAFLMNLASKYENKELTGYLSIDKYTGFAVAAGYYYEGCHTIDGQEYLLSLQYDQSMELPSIGAYQEITEKMPEETEPENKATPLFYHVTGENGQEMWLLGTIHVGDVRTGFLPSEIYEAFVASDALALECNTEAFDKLVEEDDKLSEEVSDHYFYSDGTTIESLLEEEQYKEAVRLMKATGSYNMNAPYAKPYLWSNSIELFYLRQGYQLHGDMGVEERLCDWAEELGKEIREVESNMFQIEMLTSFSNDLQLLMLEDVLELDGRESWEATYELYEMWCAGDEEALRKELSDEVDLSELTPEEVEEYEQQKHLLEEYNKAMSYDRNDHMLEVAIEYLESGDTVFYAVGLAHLLNNVNGLVDTLAAAGYTVELVTYQ